MSLLGFTLVITLILFSLSVFYFVNRSERVAWQGRQSEAARNAAGTVSGFIQRVEDALSIVSVVEPDRLVSDPDELDALIQKNPAILEIVRMDASGRIFASASRDKSVLSNLITIPQSQWFLQARAGQTFIGDMQLSANNEPYLIMAVPSADEGVVAARVKMNVLWDVVQNIQFGKSGEIIVINRTGNIIAHTNPEFVVSRQTLIGRPELASILNAPRNEWAGSYDNFHGDPVVGVTARVPGTDWIIITELPESEAFTESRTAVFVLGFEALFLMLLASFTGVSYVRLRIVNPMEQLRDGADRIGKGDLNHRIGMIRKDEIGQLASAFDVMTNRLQQHKAQVDAKTIALQDSEASLRRITDNMFDVITQIGADGTILYASPSNKWVLGVDPTEMVGKPIFEGLHPDDMAEALTIFSQAAAEGVRPEIFALRYRHANGEYLWMECVSSILRDDQGEFSGAILSSRDISKRKRMETELSTNEQRYRLLADNASDVIWMADMNMQMNYISPAVEKLRGYSVEEALSQNFAESLTPESDEYAIKYFAEIMMDVETGPTEPLKGASRTLELEMTRKDGSTVWTETKVSFLLDEQGQPIGVLGVSRDITERRRATVNMRQLNMELENRVSERTSELVAEITERKRVESALRESEERYELAMRGANDGLWDWDLRTNIIYYSPRWKSMLGIGEDEILNDPQDWFKRIHPDDLAEFKALLDAHLGGKRAHLEAEYRISHASGKERWMLCRGLAVRDAEGRAYRMSGSLTDITDRKIAEARLTHDALHDVLTGLPNRNLLLDRLGRRLEYGKRHKDRLFAVLFLDLDRFKVINDSLGHSVGDEFLVAVAQLFQTCLRQEDTISRLGGDEFAILLNEINDVGDAVHVAERLQSRLAQGVMLGSVNRSSSTSIGITVYNGQYSEPEELLRDADTAMYRAKALGGGCCQVFDVKMYESAITLLELEADLKRAVENGEWLVYYQPILSLEDGGISGLEALVRWNCPKRGIVPPADFIPLAEESGLIIPIGEYVLREACAQLKIWRKKGHTNLWVSVNISGRQFRDRNFGSMVKEILKESRLPGHCLRLEITESVAMKDFEYSVNVLRALEKSGIHFSLDDFGKGYSSLAYLKNFPLKTLKVDRSFVQDIGLGRKREAIAASIISMGHSLGMKVVAEGVETQEQLAFLRTHSCNEVQGFLFSRPLPQEEISRMIEGKKSLFHK